MEFREQKNRWFFFLAQTKFFVFTLLSAEFGVLNNHNKTTVAKQCINRLLLYLLFAYNVPATQVSI